MIFRILSLLRLHVRTRSPQCDSTDELFTHSVLCSECTEFYTLRAALPDLSHLIISQLLATHTVRRPLTVKPVPASPQSDVANGLEDNAELFGQGQQLLARSTTTPDLQYLLSCQLVQPVPLAPIVLPVAQSVSADVLRARPPAEVGEPCISFPGRAVARFLTGRTKSHMRLQNKDVHRPVLVLPWLGEADERVPARPLVDVRPKDSSAVPSRPCPSNHYSIQAAHSAEVRHLVQVFVTNYWEPALGNIVRSHGDLLQDRRVRPGRCPRRRGRAVMSRVATLCRPTTSGSRLVMTLNFLRITSR